jgi:ethanolamine ammonia-lyase small subunit
VTSPETWDAIRAATPARVALGRAGGSLPTAAHLRFRADQARARDAVNHDFDAVRLAAVLTEAGHRTTALVSAAATREEYIRRPDLGRVLSDASRVSLLADADDPCDLAIVLCDGLSPRSIERHGPALVGAITSSKRLTKWSRGPIIVVSNGRVAVGDDVGSSLGAHLVLVLIGERPGLTVPESVGAYLTFEPAQSRTDAQRNCVSNIHDRGLTIDDAARRIVGLAVRASLLGSTGVGLHDDDPTVSLDLSPDSSVLAPKA